MYRKNLFLPPLISENLLIDDVVREASGWSCDKEVRFPLNSGTRHVKLAVGETGLVKCQADGIDRLALAFVDCHCERQSNGELKSLEFKRQLRV